MTKEQVRDMKRCDKLQLQGIDMDCLECSCNCCIAQQESMFDKKDLMLIRKSLEKYKSEAYSVLLRTDFEALDLHEETRLKVNQINELLDKVDEYLNL